MKKWQKWYKRPFSGQNMAFFDQKLWAEPSTDISVSTILKSNPSEHNFIHFYVLLISLVMKQLQKWSKIPFSGQNMAIFNQKLWSEPSNDMFVWSVLKSNLSEHNFIHFYELITCPVLRNFQKWSKKPYSGQYMVIFDQK